MTAISEILPQTPPSVYTLKRRWLGTKSYWLCQLLGWGLMVFTQMISFLMQPVKDNGPFDQFLYLFFLAVTGTFLTHLLRVVYLRFRNRQYGWKLLIPSTMIWAYYAALGMAGVTFIVIILGNPNGIEWSEIKSPSGYPEFFSFSLGCWLSFMCWSGFYFGALAFRQYQVSSLKLLQMDSALKESKLRVLRAQVNPHFLFNSLNTVRAMIPHDLIAPRKAVTVLADFLRSSLTSDDKETVPFSEELEVVENYLALEKLRLEERLNVDMVIDPVAKRWPIPPFLFQTLVENAVKYGVSRNESGGPIRIKGDILEGCLVLTILNCGRINEKMTSTRLGMRNSRDRLELLYGPAASLSIEQTDENTVTTKIVVPFYLSDEDKDS